MNHDQKLAFIAGMTDKALQHAASTPNVPTQDGKMSHEKMLSFVTAMANKGVQHLDQGGTILSGPTTQQVPGQDTTAGGVFGGISSFLGTNDKYQAQAAPIQAGANVNQLNNAYTGAQNALNTQAGLAGTLNTGLNQGVNSQSTLANLYTQQAQGVGPNPALAQLSQTTGQNIAQQAALAAGQRGAGANAGLIARQNAQQGAATQQQAVGQAATQSAEQQLAAEQNLQNLSANQVAQGTSATQAYNQTQQGEQGLLQNANTAANNANVSQQANINNVNAGISTGNANTAGNVVSGIGNAAASLPLIGALFAKGGEVEPMPWHVAHEKMMADGGIIGQQTSAPISYVGNWLNSNVDTSGPGQQQAANLNTKGADPFGFAKSMSPMGGAPAQQSQLKGFDPGAVTPLGEMGATDLPAISDVGAMAMVYKGGLMKNGGKVSPKNPNQKAVKDGDSLANDKIPAMLSQGEVVIDRDTMKDPGPIGQMARALAKHIATRNKSK